ncbi:hypothetical protein YC2023_024483 [Brassica napus]
MASLEMVSTKMFECVPSDRSKKEKDLKVLARDQSDNFRVFPVDDSGSKQDGNEVLECSSRTSVSETEEAQQIIYSPETNSNAFYNLAETENPSRNEIIMGASSLVQIWEARSRPSSPTRNHFFIDSLFFESLNDEARNNGDEVDWCLQSNISDSCEKEKERESRCSPPSVRIRGRQAFEDFLMMILRERKKYLKWIAGLTAVSKFSPRGCERLQYMLRIRSFERCIAMQERHLFKSSKRSSRGSGVMNNLRYKKNIGQPKIANEAVLSEDTSNKNGLKKHETERKYTEEGEGSGETTEKGIVMGSVVTNNTLSIAEKVNLWDSKERSNMGKAKNEGKAARSGIDVEVTEVIDIETDGYRLNPQDVTSMISLEKRKEEENASRVSRERHTDEMFSKDDGETSKDKKLEASETLCLVLESPRFLNGWVKHDMEGEDEYEDYSGESVNYDWVSHISRPRSYWDDLRKERELEIIKKLSKKDDIFQKLIKERTVFSFLTSDFRKNIEKILISRPQKGLEVKGNHVDGEASEECSAEYQEKEKETESVDLESVIVCDGFSQDSAMKTWSFEDHEPYLKDHENTSSETQMICGLMEEVKKMQREMLELKGFVKSCVDFQKFKSASEAISQINGRPVLQPKSNQVPTLDRRNSLKKSPPKSLIHPIASKIASPRPISLNSPPLSPNSKPIRKLAYYEKPKPAAKPVKLSERTDGGCREVKSTVTVQKQPGSIAAARREEVAMKQEERKKKISHYGRVKSVLSNEKSLNVEHEKKKRCSFITTSSDPIYVAYHDEEWGVPVHDDNLLFELLVLTGAQVGSDWTSVLKRRNTFREAFSGFEAELVAEFNEKKIQSIVNDYGIGLSQVLAVVDNSKQILKVKRDFGSFNKYFWGFMKHKPVTTKYTSCQKIPVKTSKSETISKDMVRRGFRFVGPTVIHSLMQAAGLTNDHLITCPRHLECMAKAAL